MKLATVNYIALFLLITMSFASASFDLSVEKIDKGSVIISEIQNPAMFDLIITNNGEGDTAEIYSLVGVSMSPKGTFSLPRGKTTISVVAYPGEDFRNKEGLFSFEYQIKGINQGIYKDKLTIKIVPLQSVFLIDSLNLHKEDKNLSITIKNNVNANLESVDIELSSIFFETTKKLSFKPFETIEIPIQIDNSKNSKLVAGSYPLQTTITIEDHSVKTTSNIYYIEKEEVSLSKSSTGFLIKETTYTKTNEGNVPIKAQIEMNKDIISRLFTRYSIEPLKAERSGLIVGYVWQEDIKPGESFSIAATTNYTYIAGFILLIVLIGVFVKFYTLSPLLLHKSVSHVKTHGGEFALKVRIRVKARKDVKNLQISDRLPHMTKLYDKFGKSPDKIDEATRRIFWNIPHLNSGEERVFSYIIYSKLRAVGHFELPSAMALFEREGKKMETISNKTRFMSETTSEE